MVRVRQNVAKGAERSGSASTTNQKLGHPKTNPANEVENQPFQRLFEGENNGVASFISDGGNRRQFVSNFINSK